ncbi:hypothetical protein FNV43_RR25100 [Rhamnella rubrinervis]|uniref:SKP1-like protein n=1 Tax=Rhamnella rubrinervis TaxID=2594499 RepID=A0A8K0DMR3_9ROSA|nr:hypothetical protein FNV43_RR25100 [Rhamnella rubrinervis]
MASSTSGSSSSSKVVKIRSSDNENFEVEEAAAARSETIKKLLEDVGDDADVIPLPNVDAKTLVKVMEWCKKHMDDVDELNKEEMKTWDAEFVDMDQSCLYNVLLAANFLNIKELLDQLTQKVADMIKGKSPEEIRATFNIKNDFTPEEEAEIRKQNAWAFE